MPSVDTQFKKGRTKTGGRKKGTRDKIVETYLSLLSAAQDNRGVEALDKAIDSHPDVLLKLLSALVPKDLDVKHSGDVTIQIVDYKDDE